MQRVFGRSRRPAVALDAVWARVAAPTARRAGSPPARPPPLCARSPPPLPRSPLSWLAPSPPLRDPLPCLSPPSQSLVATEDFTHILRVLNTNVDGKQRIAYALTAIKGIGRRYANICCKKAEVDLNLRYVATGSRGAVVGARRVRNLR